MHALKSKETAKKKSEMQQAAAAAAAAAESGGGQAQHRSCGQPDTHRKFPIAPSHASPRPPTHMTFAILLFCRLLKKYRIRDHGPSAPFLPPQGTEEPASRGGA